MRILFLTASFPPLVGGITSFVLGLATGCELLGAHVEVVTSVPDNGHGPYGRLMVFRTSPCFSHKSLRSAGLAWGALQRLARNRPDVVVAMTWTHEGLAARFVRTLYGDVPYIVVAHGTEITRHQTLPITRRLMINVLSGARRVIANSTFTKNTLLRLGIAEEQVVVVHPPIDLSLAKVGLAAEEINRRFQLQGKRVLFTAARLVKRKGHAQVIRAVATLSHRYPNLVYVMTGRGDDEPMLRKLAEELGVSDRIRITGFVSQEVLSGLYSRAEVYVSPSLEDDGDVEGFGISFGEAAAHGLPVLAGRSGGVAEIVQDSVTGLLVNPLDMGQLCAQLRRLLDDDDLKRQLGDAGLTYVSAELTSERQSGRLLAALTQQ